MQMITGKLIISTDLKSRMKDKILVSKFPCNVHELMETGAIMNLSTPYLHVYKPHFFSQESTFQNWGAAYTGNIMSF
jgi:hypothetical protein